MVRLGGSKFPSDNLGFMTPTMYLIAGIIIVSVLVTGTLGYKFYDLKSENADLALDNERLETENKKLIAINEQNVIVIEQMKLDKKNADKIMSSLEQQKSKDAAELNKLRKEIRKMVKLDPSKDAPVAPVLAQTVTDIQKHYFSVTTEEKAQ